jgi:hypothetical protein
LSCRASRVLRGCRRTASDGDGGWSARLIDFDKIESLNDRGEVVKFENPEIPLD